MENVLPFVKPMRKIDVEESVIAQIPIVKQTLLLLECADEDSGIKLTTTGKVNRALVQNFWLRFVKPFELMPFKPYMQSDCPEITKAIFLIEASGWVKCVSGRMVLSNLGKNILRDVNLDQLYIHLLFTYLQKWNWSCEDLYPEHDFIQDSADSLLVALADWRSNDISPKEFFKHCFKIASDAPIPEINGYWSPEDSAARCFQLRFFDRFAIPFGLLEVDRKSAYQSITRKYNKTQFLENNLINLIAKWVNF